jgi:hypothetical protein
MTTREVLQASRDRIADPERWCQGAYAKNKGGLEVCPLSPEACQWCVSGSIMKTINATLARNRYSSLLDRFSGYLTIERANDLGGHAAILAAFDKAIAGLLDDDA